MVQVRLAALNDLPAILEIYNYAIRNLTATFDLEEQTIEQRRDWFDQHVGKYPLIVAEINGEVVGYSSLSPFREKEAYSQTAELSIYISPNHQGHGIGKKLMEEILKLAGENHYHVIIAGITGGNEASIHLHKRFGFEYIGCFKEVGFKFGEWQDVDFYQLLIK